MWGVNVGDNIIKTQQAIEKEMVQLGKNRYRKEVLEAKQKTREATTPYGIQFIGNGAHRITKRINKVLRDYKRGRPTLYTQDAIIALKLLPPDVSAFIGLKVCVNHMSNPISVQKVAMEIGSMIEDEYRLRQFKKNKPALFGVVRRDLAKRTTNYRKQKRVLMHSANKAGVPLDNMRPSMKLRVGMMMIDFICQETGLFACVRTTVAKNRTPIYFQATEKTLAWIKKKNSICELLSPVKLPTVIPPKPWSNSIFQGGYYNVDSCLIKSDNKGYLNQLELMCQQGQLKEVTDAVNNLQNTKWRVNGRILEVMNYYKDKQIDIPCLPPQEDLERKPYPEKGVSKEELVEWKRHAGRVYEENVRRKTKRVQHSQLLWVANKFSEYDKIYFPHNLDFRGRAYASSSFLNPQAEDTGRSLLEFAEGKVLGESGFSWLMVHGANCWGYDKVSLEDRVEWVKDNHKEILAIGGNPYEHTKWIKADKPWQFLAFCFEYWATNRHGYGIYSSRLPIGIDGSCNGIQHFSALLLDSTGGKAVNLTPQDEPQDIYQIVADKVQDIIEETNPQSLWNGRVTRALVKRPVMTTPYGATLYGMREQIRDQMRKQQEKGEVYPFDIQDTWGPAAELSKYVWGAIGQVVVAARNAMGWLQDVARVANESSQGALYWTLPTGYLVRQSYKRPVKKNVRTVLNGKFCFLNLKLEGANIDTQKQVNSISPNLVHSLDSCHMMKTINSCFFEKGILDFHMVHDSFGVHAADVELLTEVAKQEFINMYSKEDLLQVFRSELQNQVKGELPPTPKKGKLNLKKILDADFFFS